MPVSKESDESVLATAASWKKAGRAAAVATVVKCWGSAPCPPGSRLAVRADGLFAGSVSGGCIEADVITRAQDAITQGRARIIEYGVSDAKAWEAGLACGGRIEIHVAPVVKGSSPGIGVKEIGHILADKAARRPVVLATSLDEACAQEIIHPGRGGRKDFLTRFAAEALRAGQARVEVQGKRRWFFHPFAPQRQLVLIGAAHIAESLSQMAALAGYEIVIIDPRAAFADPERFPDLPPEKLIAEWPDEVLDKIGLGGRSALVALSHDPKIDDPALLAALNSDCFYIGALGSRKTHAARLERLKAQGAKPAALARIHGPVGLALGGRGPVEIAISILAQLTQKLRAP